MAIDPSTPFLLGIDVSNHQGNIDWNSVRGSEIVYACTKATEGTYYQDVWFPHNWSGIKSAGIIRGAYHFFRANYDADAQAQYFLSYVQAQGGFGPGDFIMLDVESADNQSADTVVNGAAEWVKTVRQRTRKTVFLYTANWFWQGELGDPVNSTLASCPLWQAAYTSPPAAPRNWHGGWTIWQSSDGQSGWPPYSAGGLPPCDIDRYYGTLASFRTLLGGQPTAQWAGLGGKIEGGLTTARNADGRLEVLVRGTDGEVWHIFQAQPNGGWDRWASLGGQITGRVVAHENQDGRIAIFARGTDGALWHIFQNQPNGGWSEWASMGGEIEELFACGRNGNGGLEIVAGGPDGAVWHTAQEHAGGGWSGWTSLGGQIDGALTIEANADGRLEVFARGTDGALWHSWQTGTGWSDWASLGGSIGTLLAVGQNQDGRLEVFADGGDHAVWHTWQQAPGSNWYGWATLGAAVNDVLAVGRNQDGGLEVFARGEDNALWHIAQQGPNDGWGGWQSLGGRVADLLSVATNADGRLEVFIRGMDEGLYHIWQSAPGSW